MVPIKNKGRLCLALDSFLRYRAGRSLSQHEHRSLSLRFSLSLGRVTVPKRMNLRKSSKRPFLENNIAIFFRISCSKSPDERSKICNINFWIENDPPWHPICNECEYKTSEFSNLGMHRRTHTLDKPRGCNMCEFSRIEASYLRIHITRRHIEEKPHMCNQCNFSFVSSSHLNQHMRRENEAAV